MINLRCREFNSLGLPMIEGDPMVGLLLRALEEEEEGAEDEGVLERRVALLFIVLSPYLWWK